ncbi:LOW QUALITY PROTEIN: target of rapamycin complex subunit lst8-like [Gigantopelta aegis]|uniref:LOW QUALITY PROTEIN: target of rapamycin complex subunit lst8-like n=1 Tax=Gigantopelta aegis TaxID=1735272 RepID=UPI001B8881C3|nr:LOW QUALITY PROTEIN: target of rapamycin complex subunit lst8-like [Gigantopelta aegis]
MDSSIVLVTGGYDHCLKFWYPHDGVCYRTIPHPDSQVNQLAITPDKRHLVSAAHQQIRMYDINSSDHTPIYVFEAMTKNVTSVGFYQNGQFMFSGGEDCMARIWDLRGQSQQCQRLFQVTSPVNCMCLHPTKATLIVGDQSGTVHVWDLTTDYNEQLIPEPEVPIHSVHIDSDGAYLAAVNSKVRHNTIYYIILCYVRVVCYVWSLSSGSGSTHPITLTPKTKTAAHKRYALKCLFSPDSSLLATTSADGTCKIWSTADFSLQKKMGLPVRGKLDLQDEDDDDDENTPTHPSPPLLPRENESA